MQLLKTKRLWLSARDISCEFGVAKSTAYLWIAEGLFGEPVRLNCTIRVHRDCVLRYIERSRAAAGEELGIYSAEI